MRHSSRRLLSALAYHATVVLSMLLIMSFITTAMIEVLPGSYCNAILPDHASVHVRQRCEQQTPSLLERYVASVQRLLVLDLGVSLSSRQPVAWEVANHLPSTITLALATLAISLPLGIVGGTCVAWFRHTTLGHLTNFVAIATLSLPSFLISLLLINLFVFRLKWLPILSDGTGFKGLIMPVLALSIPLSSLILRITRNVVVDILSKDYIRTAYAKGLRRRAILTHHIVPNTIPVLVELIVIILVGLLDGTLIIEAMFVRPGLGSYTLRSLLAQDYPALQGVVLTVTLLNSCVSLSAAMIQRYFLPQQEAKP